MKTHVLQPDLSSRPLCLTVTRRMRASPAAIYRAWTEQFDRWFAAPGTVLMRATVNAPFYFETRFSNEQVKERRHPHYGRFLKLKPRKQIVMTWVTGPEGTAGAETVLTVALRPDGKGTELMLTHAGFIGEKSLKQHEEAWPQVLENLDEVLSKSGKR